MPAPQAADPPPPRLYRSTLALMLAATLLALLLTWGLRQQAVRQMSDLHAQAAEQLAHALALARPASADLPGFLTHWPGLGAMVEIQLHDAAGLLLAQRRLPAPTLQAPANLGKLMRLPDQPAQVMLQINGQVWQLRVAASPAAVLDMLWSLLAPALAIPLLMGLLAWGLGRRASRRLDQAVEQALQALQPVIGSQAPRPAAAMTSGLAFTSPEGRVLQPLLLGLHQIVSHQRLSLAAQDEQLEQLRDQAHRDPLTGLPNRRHFLATLDATFGSAGAPVASGLVLLRLRDLAGLNQSLGRTATDPLLQALGQCLSACTLRIAHGQVGRLSGADFALWLPVDGLATETAAALLQAVRGALSSIHPGASVAAGAVELPPAVRSGTALALADLALARAEAGPGFAMSAPLSDPQSDGITWPLGQAAWQRQIEQALAQGRVALGAYPVRTADGRLLHLDCPLRVALSADGPLAPASRWLSQALRSGLSAAVDEQALALALGAIGRDGLARCINVAAQSVADPAFIAMVTRRLQAQPDAASRLWIDLPEALALERPALVRELSRHWRPLGVMLGLEHAGDALPRMPSLMDLGLDCVRIDSRFVNGLTGPGTKAARHYLQGLVQLVQSVGLQACAEGVRSADDLDVLWSLGFDAATGPALVAEPQMLPA